MKKAQSRILGIEWDLESVWGEAMRSLPDRPLMKRDYLYASEIGGSFRDRYLKMFAHPYSNPFNPRAKLKMLAGKFFEDIVGLILTGCGIVKEKQLSGRVELPGLLKVSGRLDFIAGGTIDWDFAKDEAERLKRLFSFTKTETGEFVTYMVDYILPHFKNLFSYQPAMEYVLECKSVSGFVFQLINSNGKPRLGHDFQALHYLIANKEIPKAILTYISREDCMLKEIFVEKTPQLLKAYKQDVATMTEYYNYGQKNYLKHLPPPDPEVIFEEASWSFRKNNLVEYSPYLTFTFNIKSIDDFKAKWDKPLSQYNRVFKRIVKGDNLTAANKTIIEEAKKTFPDFDKLVEQARKAGAFDKPETEEEND